MNSNQNFKLSVVRCVSSPAFCPLPLPASHSDDGVTDGRLMFVPSVTHAAGEMRNVYYDTEEYPRYIVR